MEGLTIFPGAEPAVKDIVVKIPAAEIDKHMGRTRSMPGMRPFLVNTDVKPVIVGTITYRFVWNREKHQTGFIIQLNRVDPADPNTFLGIDPKLGDVSQVDLRISDFYLGSALID